MKVLIVEDDEAIADLLYVDLRDEGYQCTCVSNGAEAANLLEESFMKRPWNGKWRRPRDNINIINLWFRHI